MSSILSFYKLSIRYILKLKKNKEDKPVFGDEVEAESLVDALGYAFDASL